MLDRAFNLILRMHSRAATLVRPATPDNLEAVCRITPSNYFRHLEGPSSTIIEGREFVIPVASLGGFQVELITFGITAPTGGTMKLGNSSGDSSVINFDDNAAAVQAAIRAIDGYEDVTVTGDFDIGFTVSLINVANDELLTLTDDSLDDLDDFEAEFTGEKISWSPLIKVGDRISDTALGSLHITEVQEMCDFGGDIMGFRVRCD